MLRMGRLSNRVRWLLFSVLVVVAYYSLPRFRSVRRIRYAARYEPEFQCPIVRRDQNQLKYHENLDELVQEETRVLLVRVPHDPAYDSIKYRLDQLKLTVIVETIQDGRELLLDLDGVLRFQLVVFTDVSKFYGLPQHVFDSLVSLANSNVLRIISFARSSGAVSDLHLSDGKVPSFVEFVNDELNQVVKVGVQIPVQHASVPSWTHFSNYSGWQPILQGEIDKQRVTLALYRTDPFEHVVLGTSLAHWVAELTFFQALLYLLGPKSVPALTRYIQVDIDDIFVGQPGTRIVSADVDVLKQVQLEWRDHFVENFTFTLGFSGAFLGRGSPEEAAGDSKLIAESDQFLWFPHMWKHNHAHEYSYENLTILMKLNRDFALEHGLRICPHYAVAPLHNGVYPVHDQLYRAWKDVWNVTVTSTEGYPHLDPLSKRSGFIWNGVSVLPRQTCGLFTHTLYYHALPYGFDRLKKNSEGGDLFISILYNQNFGNDRLGIFAFSSLFKFIKCWTRLRLRWVEPVQMASKYFERFPKAASLKHTDICKDRRHLAAVTNVTCNNSVALPNLLIVGPQKTGTTALLQFLNLHPNVSSNRQLGDSFEEAQFFGQKHYEFGSEWYRSLFTDPKSIVVEKSANYLDNPDAPAQVYQLIPNAKLVIILMDPVDRAYAWYQHARAHNDPVALNNTIDQLFSDNSTSTQRLRGRCLRPGKYVDHLERWLNFFPISRFMFVDGRELKQSPAKVLNILTQKLGLGLLNYENVLKFDTEKGFYCTYVNSKRKCLGTGKGRKYPPLNVESRRALAKHFHNYNKKLRKWLIQYNISLPYFLRDGFNY